MEISKNMTGETLLKVIGERLAQVRLSKNLTQEQLADQAGIGLRTVQRLELGAAATQLSSFVRVCRMLGLVERFEVLIPEAAASPIAQLKLQSRKRKRATGRKTVKSESKKWTWGEPS